MSESIQGIERLFRRVSRISQNISREIERPMKAGGTYMLGSIEKNFRSGGRPKTWQKLAASTVMQRRKGKGRGGMKVLVDTAAMKNSMSMRVRPAETHVGTNAVQARRQHHGYPGKKGAGRGHSTTPKRPFVMFQDEDYDAIGQIFSRHVRQK